MLLWLKNCIQLFIHPPPLLIVASFDCSSSHKERAQREYERLVLVEQLEKKRKEDEEHYNSLHNKSIQSQLQVHAVELEEKKRLARMATARVPLPTSSLSFS